MLVSIFHQIIMIIGESVLLGGLEPGDEVFDVYGVDAKYLECSSDEDSILYDRHECWVDILIGHIEFLCWKCIGGWSPDLVLPLQYLYWRYCGVEGNNPSWLKPCLRPHHYGDGEIRSATRGFLEVDAIGHCVDEPLFFSTLLLAFIYAMVILMSEHAHNIHTRGEGR